MTSTSLNSKLGNIIGEQEIVPRRIAIIISVLFCLLTPLASRAEDLSKPRNIVLIVLDAVGAQHLHLPEAPRPYLPTIARLSNQGTVFERAYTVAPWTMPAVSSILTGLMPYKHEVTTTRSKLQDSSRTLAEVLRERNFSTMAVTSHTFLDVRHGFSQGFEQFKQVNDTGKTHSAITSQLVSWEASNWLKDQVKDQVSKGTPKNLFMFLHFFDAHFNFRHHPDFDLTQQFAGKTRIKPGMSLAALEKNKKSFSAADLSHLKLLLAEELAYIDHHIGLIVKTLEQLGLMKDTLIIITADHGEGFMEHGSLGHTVNLFDELLHVPLIVSGAGVPKGLVVTDPVSILDIFPTIIQALNLPEETKYLDGVSLLPKNIKRTPERILLAEVGYRGHDNKVVVDKASARVGRYKLIVNRSTRRKVLFDTTLDPAEKRDIFAELETTKPELIRALLEKLSKMDAPETKPSGSAIEFKNKEIEQLKTLGYF